MFESVSFPEETPEEECETRSGSGRAHSLQDAFLQKRGALLLRSKRRVDGLKAKAAQAKRAGEAPPTGNEASAATAPPSVCSEDAAPQLQWRRPPPGNVSHLQECWAIEKCLWWHFSSVNLVNYYIKYIIKYPEDVQVFSL